MGLHLRAGADAARAALPSTPMPVATETVQVENSYTVQDAFIGRIEAARQAQLAFERGGLIIEVLVDEGDEVAEGDIVAVLDTRLLEAERDRLVGETQAVAADLELSRLTEKRQKRLSEDGHSSVQRYDEARLASRALAARLTSTRAALERLDVELEKSVLLAAFSGRVATRWRDPGNVVDAGLPVIELLETGRPQARIGVTPETAASIQTGQVVSLTGPGGGALEGRVSRIRPDLTPATRTVSILVDLDPGIGRAVGDTVTLRLDRRVDAQGVWLPVASLNEGQRGLWTVMTVVQTAEAVSADGFELQKDVVQVLHTDGDRAFVSGSLKSGDRIVSSGRHRISAGQRVQLATPATGGQDQ